MGHIDVCQQVPWQRTGDGGEMMMIPNSNVIVSLSSVSRLSDSVRSSQYKGGGGRARQEKAGITLDINRI